MIQLIMYQFSKGVIELIYVCKVAVIYLDVAIDAADVAISYLRMI